MTFARFALGDLDDEEERPHPVRSAHVARLVVLRKDRRVMDVFVYKQSYVL